MNDLDRKIAELKGFEVLGSLVTGFHPESADGIGYDGLLARKDGERFPLPSWAGSDSKALELVDEYDWPEFRLRRLQHENGRGPAIGWEAEFVGITKQGATTRPEAICRAYIAAVTWMKENQR